MSRQRRGRKVAAAGLAVLALAGLRAPGLRATDYRAPWAPPDTVLEATPAPLQTPAFETETTQLIDRDFASWKIEVYRPLTFTNRTCVRLRRQMQVRCAGRSATRDELLELEEQLVSVRRGMLDRATAFVPQTAAMRVLNRALCETLRMHVDWMLEVSEARRNGFPLPAAPAALVAAKRDFSAELAKLRCPPEPE